MIGDEYVDSALMSSGDPFDTGDAVVDRNDELRSAFGGQRDNFRSESITELEAVRNQKIDLCSHGR